jgi:hypothetical protein
VTFVNRTWFFTAVAPVEMPIGLNHLDSDFWCDPIVEIDENGQQAVLHREVTWSRNLASEENSQDISPSKTMRRFHKTV